jgi:hypothetical protein
MFIADPGSSIRFSFHPRSQLPDHGSRIRIACYLPGLQIRIHSYAEILGSTMTDWDLLQILITLMSIRQGCGSGSA